MFRKNFEDDGFRGRTLEVEGLLPLEQIHHLYVGETLRVGMWHICDQMTAVQGKNRGYHSQKNKNEVGLEVYLVGSVVTCMRQVK